MEQKIEAIVYNLGVPQKQQYMKVDFPIKKRDYQKLSLQCGITMQSNHIVKALGIGHTSIPDGFFGRLDEINYAAMKIASLDSQEYKILSAQLEFYVNNLRCSFDLHIIHKLIDDIPCYELKDKTDPDIRYGTYLSSHGYLVSKKESQNKLKYFGVPQNFRMFDNKERKGKER